MRAILIALALMAAAPALAGDLLTAPPSPPVSPSDVDSLSKAGFARSFVVGAITGTLGDMPLSRFVSQAKAGKVETMSGNGVAMSWACYDVAGVRAWLSVTDEMGNGKSVDTITLKPRDMASSNTCAPLASQQAPVVDGAIRIGMTKADLIARLGSPSKQKAGWLVFRANPSIKSGGSFFTTLIVRIDNGKVAFIEASNTSAD